MWRPGGNEKEVGWPKRPVRRAIEERALPLSDDVKLVARVWRLRVVTAWSVELNDETPMLEQRD
jgi:hypothetical protein